MLSRDTVFESKRQTRIFASGKQLVLRGLTAGLQPWGSQKNSCLLLLSPHEKNGVAFPFPEWSGMCYSVETRKTGEKCWGGQKDPILLVLTCFGE